MIKNQLVKTAIPIIAISFFSFILWVIYLANTGQNSVFFRFIASIPYGDKLGHFCLFGGLTLVANFAFKLKTRKVASFEIFLGSLLVFCFVVIEEFSQYFIPNRNFDFIDLSADFIGIAFFTLLTSLVKKQRLSCANNSRL